MKWGQTSTAGRAHVLIKGKKFPVIACITANHLEILLELDSQVFPGDEADGSYGSLEVLGF